MLPIGHVPTQIYVNKTYIPHYNLAITQLLVCNKMHQQNINQQQIRQNCTRHSEWLELPFSCGNWSCSTQDLSEIRSLQNNEPARQKSVHDYPPLPSPMEYGWRTVKDSLHPVYFEGNMSAESLRVLVCSCKGKSQGKMSCVCAEQNLACTDLCFYVNEAPLLKVVIKPDLHPDL
jgi:hypothetical protein